MKILVAIPVYDGKLPVETARCLLDEQMFGIVAGDQIAVRFLPSCSHAAMGRNQLAQDFLESDSERLVFLDSDVTCEPGAISKIARHPVDFVGGAYRFKVEAENYPIGWPESGDLWANEHGLLEVVSIPGGFMSLSREVFTRLKDAHPERSYNHEGHRSHCFFQMLYSEGNLYGEDSFFCKEWREAGGKVFLDPEISLTHWEFNRPYPGHVGSWLKRRNGIGAES